MFSPAVPVDFFGTSLHHSNLCVIFYNKTDVKDNTWQHLRCVHPHTPSQLHLPTRRCCKVLADSLTLRWSDTRLQNTASLALVHFNANNSHQCQPRVPHSMQNCVVAFSETRVGVRIFVIYFKLLQKSSWVLKYGYQPFVLLFFPLSCWSVF